VRERARELVNTQQYKTVHSIKSEPLKLKLTTTHIGSRMRNVLLHLRNVLGMDFLAEILKLLLVRFNNSHIFFWMDKLTITHMKLNLTKIKILTFSNKSQ
jgi:hypothetical protein